MVISDIDTAKLSVQFFFTFSAVCSFIKVLFYINKTLSGRLRELENEGKVQLGNPKGGRARSWERSLTRAFHYKVLIHSLYKESLDCIQ